MGTYARPRRRQLWRGRLSGNLYRVLYVGWMRDATPRARRWLPAVTFRRLRADGTPTREVFTRRIEEWRSGYELVEEGKKP
jgi:hypothetical protein